MTSNSNVIRQIKLMFAQQGSPASIPLLRGDCFTAELTENGVYVSNLSNQPFLPWIVFEETVNIITQNGGIAKRGDAMDSRMGEPNLPLNSIEGHIARVVYGRSCGDSVFRRITPIANILIWAEICEAKPGVLILK